MLIRIYEQELEIGPDCASYKWISVFIYGSWQLCQCHFQGNMLLILSLCLDDNEGFSKVLI